MEHKISSGTEVLDKLLYGGFEKDVITTVYGPAGTGKTNICLFAAVDTVKKGKKVVYIDSEGGFSIERFKQIAENYEELLDKIILLKPTRFEEQKKIFERLKELIDADTGLVIVDTISMLYRLEIGKNEDIYMINRELGQQISFLTEITRKNCIPVLITNQVYANFEDKNRVNMVGGDILKYGSKCLVELQKRDDGERKAILHKHRSIAEGAEISFVIEEKQLIEKIKEKK